MREEARFMGNDIPRPFNFVFSVFDECGGYGENEGDCARPIVSTE
jgi:hypothetical protein